MGGEETPNWQSLMLDSRQSQMMSCESSYTQALQKKILTFKDCEKMLNKCINELDQATSDHNMWTALLGTAQTISIICDVTMYAVGNLTGPVGTGINLLYGGAKLAVSGATGGVNKSTAPGIVTERIVGDYGMMADSIFLKSTKGIAFTKSLGKGAGGPVGLASIIFSTAKQISTLYKTFTVNGTSGLQAAKVTTKKQIVLMKQKIIFLQVELDKCA